jgi:hypothetical protein
MMTYCCTPEPATVPGVNYVFKAVINDKHGLKTPVLNLNMS